MSGSVNRCLLLGTIGRQGVTVRYLDSGQPCASFTLVLAEVGQDGREHLTLVECQCFGKKAEAASEIDAGTVVLFEGKLSKRRKGEKEWELVVSGYEVTPLLHPVAG